MGQKSIPMLNKAGYSLYWSSMWDDKHNYSRNLKEDIFLRSFIPLLFEDRFSIMLLNSKQLNNKKYFNNLGNVYNISLNHCDSLKEFQLHLINFDNKLVYNSKLWIWKYQTWVILYFFIYSFKYNRLLNKFKKKENNVTLSNQYNILSDYYYSLFKYKYNNFKYNF